MFIYRTCFTVNPRNVASQGENEEGGEIEFYQKFERKKNDLKRFEYLKL